MVETQMCQVLFNFLNKYFRHKINVVAQPVFITLYPGIECTPCDPPHL